MGLGMVQAVCVPVLVSRLSLRPAGDHCNSDCVPACNNVHAAGVTTKAAVAHIVPPMVRDNV